MVISLFVVAFSLGSSWLLLWYLIPQLKRRFPDQPNSRSSHLHCTPRGGGIAFVFVAVTASIIEVFVAGFSVSIGLPFIAAPLAIVGLLDDHYNLSAGLRYAIQLLTSFLLLCFSPLLFSFDFFSPLSYLVFLVVFVLLLITSTAVINFTNFMDGLDGLVAGCMVVVISSLAFVLSSSWSLLSLVGALLGFLIWNWSPAKVFMGDVGSTFLGAVFVGLVFQATSWLQALGMLLVATPLLSDAFCCLLRRFFAGQRVFEAHRLHLFQRLYQAGWPHARVSLAYIGATFILAIALIVGGWPFVTGLAGLEFLIGLWLDRRVAVPFDVASVQ